MFASPVKQYRQLHIFIVASPGGYDDNVPYPSVRKVYARLRRAKSCAEFTVSNQFKIYNIRSHTYQQSRCKLYLLNPPEKPVV